MRWGSLSCAVALFLFAQSGSSAETRSGPGKSDHEHVAPESQKKHKARGADSAQRVLERARALVREGREYQVVVIDPELAADPERVRSLDAFTVREDDGRLRPRIYINGESAIIQEATRGNDFYISVLAAVIVHEIEHLRGGNEQTARLAEMRFFQTLIAQGRIARSDGQRYLDLLEHQPAAR
jgi:hypothetical protein